MSYKCGGYGEGSLDHSNIETPGQLGDMWEKNVGDREGKGWLIPGLSVG